MNILQVIRQLNISFIVGLGDRVRTNIVSIYIVNFAALLLQPKMAAGSDILFLSNLYGARKISIITEKGSQPGRHIVLHKNT